MNRVGLGAITLESSGGGVAAVSRLIWRVFRETWGHDCRLVTLTGPGQDGPSPPRAGARLRFGIDLAASQAFGQARWILYSHLAVARVQQFVPAVLQKPYGVFIHGIEVWRDLTPAQRRVLERAQLIVANSHYTARRVTARHPWIGTIAACPLALPDTQVTPSTAESRRSHSKPTVVLVGRISAAERYKGHDQLLEAWPGVLTRVPGATLVFVGTGDDVVRLEQKAEDLGVRAHVTFAGFVDDLARARIYADAAVFAMPSREEGFGLAYLEAMSHGLPCIGTPQDAAREVIVDGETGFLVEQSAIPDLTNRIVTLLTDEPLRMAMGRRGRERLTQCFTYERFRDRLVSLLATGFAAPAQLAEPLAPSRSE